ncbi:MAG: cyclic nucleotide-binding domain-containing protein [Spirochaetales bacterium]
MSDESKGLTRELALIERVIPFRFLDGALRDELAGKLEYAHFDAGDIIIRQGDPDDRYVYLLEQGTVSITSPKEADASGYPRRITNVEPGHYFGEWEAVFDVSRTYEITADTTVESYRIAGDDFLSLMGKSPVFAQGLGTLLRDRQGIFASFDRFKAELLRSVTQGHIIVAKLLPFFRSLQPALHAGVNDDSRLDTAALSYAVRRLPENITRTFAFLLSDELVGAYSDPDSYFPSVSTSARRREVWEMLPGKNLVLVRNGLSDLFDLITCLCTYSIEAGKLRLRLNKIDQLRRISRFLKDSEQHDEASFLDSLPFTRAEREGLLEIWPGETIQRIYEIVRHREMFAIDVLRRTNTYNSRRAESWTAQLAAATREHIGYDPACLPDDVDVHVISSNTHSVTNCLNPWYRRNREQILEWGARERPEVVGDDWSATEDLVYALAREFFLANPEAARESREMGEAHGISRLESTASTGIQVQIIDVTRLQNNGLDPGIGKLDTRRPAFVVNIDYAFGEQAEHIMRNLLMLFGRNVASINFLGKAGALVGQRGDVLHPTAFVEQSSDLFQPIPKSHEQPERRLAARLKGRGLHCGPMLTVDGTLLQNRLMLHFYRHIWSCIGLEMEGTYYYRQVTESTQLGVIRPEVTQRFFYYVSDLPLAPHGSLSSRMALSEGVPPLYAITRHILDEALARAD